MIVSLLNNEGTIDEDDAWQEPQLLVCVFTQTLNKIK